MSYEYSDEEKRFIEQRNLIKNGRYFYCIKESVPTLDGKEIEKDTWVCKIDAESLNEPYYIEKLDGLYPAGVGTRITEFLLTKDGIDFSIYKEIRHYDKYAPDYFCGVDSGNFVNIKEVFKKGKGHERHVKRFLSCKKLEYWMDED